MSDYEARYIELIRNRLGIIIHPHQNKELHKTIFKACEKFDCSAYEYLGMLENCAADSPLLEHLVAGITIGETYFFRDKNQMQLLQYKILPKIIAEKRASNNLCLRIWSAGCASGEEIYTISMMLHELLPDYNAWNIHLLGSDISTPALKKALRGHYKEWSMRSIEPHYKERYFIKHQGEYQIIESIKNQVTFFYLNLNEDSYPSIANGTNAQDLILCRNVLIYFDNERIAALMKRLSFSLVESGFLMLGASDPINIGETKLHLHQNALFSQAFEVGAKDTLPPVSAKKSELTVKPTAKLKPIHPTQKPLLSRISAKSTLNERSIQDLLNKGQWQELLDQTYLTKIESPFVLNAIATALANLGKLSQATQVCDNSLVLDKNNQKTHFLRAMILLELDQIEAAEAALRTTLFLDHRFVFAHFQLGLLLLRNKKRSAGLQSLKNALAIAKTQKPDQEVAGVYGLHYARLVEILEQELDLNSNVREKVS